MASPNKTEMNPAKSFQYNPKEAPATWPTNPLTAPSAAKAADSSKHEKERGHEEGTTISVMSDSTRISSNGSKNRQVAAGGDGSYYSEHKSSREDRQGKSGRLQNRGRPFEHH